MPSLSQTVFLNSWFFLGMAATAILYAQVVRTPVWRNLGVLAASLFFLAFFIPDLATLGLLAGYLAVIYGLGQWRMGRADDLHPAIYPAAIVAFWTFLFLIKGPQLLAPLNPFFHFPIQIVGISYITFRAISYFTDADILRERSPLPFLGYMLFFPTLLAGPLARYDEFLESWRRPTPTDTPVLPHLHRIATGAIQKFVIADNLAAWGSFAIGPEYDAYHPALVALSIPAQFFLFFFDFAGYTNMMIGIAGLMGFTLPENFNRPWMARNVQEFWQRWHMSMTRFILDYVYTPLVREGLRRAGRERAWSVTVAANVFCLVLIALWHEPSLSFLTFGLAHGAALTLAQVYRRLWPPASDGGAGQVVLDWAARIATVLFVATTMALWQFGLQKTLQIVTYAVTGS